MKSSKTTPQLLAKIMTILVLGWFLFANYGIHFTALHTHHDNSDDKEHQHKSTEEHNCLVCYFQLVIYEPLLQTFFNTEYRLYNTDEYIQPFHREGVKNIKLYSSHFLRGPPFV